MSDEYKEEKYVQSPGKIRPNQLITTFGPGSLVQTEHDSVLVMGTDFWANRSEYIKKNHMYLEKITKKDHFRMPRKPKPNSRTIGCTSFPRWGSCKNCKWLQLHKEFGDEDGFFCNKCKKFGELVPARLVVTCKQGHLDEFPWEKWAHSNPKSPVPVCPEPKLQWIGGSRSSSLSSYRIKCTTCGAENPLRDATNREDGIQLYDSENDRMYQYSCTGQLPWLKKEEKCKKITKEGGTDETKTETVFGIIARASSLYYSKVIRGMIIPELAHPIVKYLQTEECKSTIKGMQKFADRKKIELTEEDIAEGILDDNEDFRLRGYTKEQIIDFREKLSQRDSKYKFDTEMDLKKIEYEDLQRNESEYDLDEAEIDEDVVIKDVELDENHKKIFQHIRQMPILTAVEVLRYFTRITPPGEITQVTPRSRHNICDIQFRSDGETKYGQPILAKKWLPCVIKKGEGIFLVFDKDFIDKCLNDQVNQRLDSMILNHKDWEETSNWPSGVKVDRQFILLHSISHLLIKELALASGYNEASISERIYSSDDMRGLLIYTTSAGDGSLGGLVRQIDLVKIIKSALHNKRTCSRDPICIEEDPKRMREKELPMNLRQNGSACFGCMLLPETSCENFNKMLDRKILVNKEFGLVREIPDA
jgi:hypothetical protein